jgi:hypothetical protein
MAEESIKCDGDNTADVIIYTDGLGMDSMAGAGAVLY